MTLKRSVQVDAGNLNENRLKNHFLYTKNYLLNYVVFVLIVVITDLNIFD